MNKIQQYSMILETVSPIHIASGNTLNTTQYLYDRAAGKVHFVDEQAWIKFLNERDLLGKFESFVTSSEKGFLYRWLVENKVKEKEFKNKSIDLKKSDKRTQDKQWLLIYNLWNESALRGNGQNFLADLKKLDFKFINFDSI